MSGRQLSSWRGRPAKQSVLDFLAAVTDHDSADFVPEAERIAVFDNDGTLWTEQPLYAQLAFAIDRAADLGHPVSLEWTAASPHRTLQLVVHHTDGDREYAYDRDPILGSGTSQILAAAAGHKWTVIDMAADWSTVHPASPWP